jgi:hypothetical protein
MASEPITLIRGPEVVLPYFKKSSTLYKHFLKRLSIFITVKILSPVYLDTVE